MLLGGFLLLMMRLLLSLVLLKLYLRHLMVHDRSTVRVAILPGVLSVLWSVIDIIAYLIWTYLHPTAIQIIVHVSLDNLLMLLISFLVLLW